MTITEAREKCKNAIASLPRDVMVLVILILASTLSFGLGYLAGRDAGQGSEMSFEPLPADSPAAAAGQVLASKNGTKYYFPECPGASRISEANKVWFPSPAAAEKAGYTPAANCPSI